MEKSDGCYRALSWLLWLAWLVLIGWRGKCKGLPAADRLTKQLASGPHHSIKRAAVPLSAPLWRHPTTTTSTLGQVSAPAPLS